MESPAAPAHRTSPHAAPTADSATRSEIRVSMAPLIDGTITPAFPSDGSAVSLVPLSFERSVVASAVTRLAKRMAWQRAAYGAMHTLGAWGWIPVALTVLSGWLREMGPHEAIGAGDFAAALAGVAWLLLLVVAGRRGLAARAATAEQAAALWLDRYAANGDFRVATAWFELPARAPEAPAKHAASTVVHPPVAPLAAQVPARESSCRQLMHALVHRQATQAVQPVEAPPLPLAPSPMWGLLALSWLILGIGFGLLAEPLTHHPHDAATGSWMRQPLHGSADRSLDASWARMQAALADAATSGQGDVAAELARAERANGKSSCCKSWSALRPMPLPIGLPTRSGPNAAKRLPSWP